MESFEVIKLRYAYVDSLFIIDETKRAKEKSRHDYKVHLADPCGADPDPTFKKSRIRIKPSKNNPDQI